MKFSLDYTVTIDDRPVNSVALFSNLNTYKAGLKDVSALEGALLVRVDDVTLPGDYEEPLVRLLHLWLGKVPWLIGGDTETVALRNSAEVFGFMPTGDGVEFSFYSGDENAVEEYIVEPTIVRLDLFVEQSIALGDKLVQLVQAIDADAFGSDEDCRNLKLSLEEAKKSWKTYLLHNRR